MLKLRDIMTPDVITVAPDLSLREAMELLTSRHIGGVPVVAGRRIVGVISATDLMTFAASFQSAGPTREDEDRGDADADEPRVESWSWDENAGPAAAYFAGSWDDGEPDVHDYFASIAQSGGERNVLDSHTVADAMTSRVCSLPSTASVIEAAEYMRRSVIHRLLVVDGDDLMGIVSTMDITRAVADHKLESRTYVFGEPRLLDAAERPHTLGSKLAGGH